MQDEKSSNKTGSFAYLQDNHTSVLGMREIISKNGVNTNSISHKAAFEIFKQNPKGSTLTCDTSSLFVYSAQCNFSGLKYPLYWIDKVKQGYLNSFLKTNSKWYILLDAACFASTNDLDLSVFKPDFLCISFYKLFGYPSGLGALLVRNSSAHTLKKLYYGGGTVNVVLSSEQFHVKKDSLHEK